MGISFSYLHFGALCERLKEFFVQPFGFKGEDVKSTGRHSEPFILLKALGSSKMLLERSLSLKRLEVDKKQDFIGAPSFKSPKFALQEIAPKLLIPEASSPKHEAATKLQKVYKSFRTRRQLADCAVLVEQRWWKLLDFALLEQNSVTYFDGDKPQTVVQRWSRAKKRAAKVGKGLSKDAKAQKLALQHWLEAIDPRHRYGHNLHFYYVCWLNCQSRHPFFYWLDVGDGKEVNLERCPRLKLQQQCIKYLGPQEREAYEVVIEDGKFVYKTSGQLLDTSEGSKDSKWIFVLSTSKALYVGQKKKGKFQHSSFLAGGATSSAGRLVIEKGRLKAVWPHSGHYRPTEENFQEFVSFLKENNVELTDVKKSPTEDDEDSWEGSVSAGCLRRNSSRRISFKRLTSIITSDINSKQDAAVQHPNVYDGMDNCIAVTESSDPCPTSEELTHSSSTESNATFGCLNQNIFMGSEGESGEDANDQTCCTSKIVQEPCCSLSLPETQSDSDEAMEELASSNEKYVFLKKNLFEEGQDENEEQPVNRELMLQRINSKNGKKSYQLGKQLSFMWTTGAGPRISCVRDYPSEIQFRALEQVNLSPRSAGYSKSGASTPRISACSSTPRLTMTSLLKQSSLDSFST